MGLADILDSTASERQAQFRYRSYGEAEAIWKYGRCYEGPRISAHYRHFLL